MTHAAGYLRDAFEEWVEGGCTASEVGADLFDDGTRSIRWLFGQLWQCSDIMPRVICQELDLPDGSSYAQAVQELTRTL